MLRTENNKTLKNIFKCFLRNQKKKSTKVLKTDTLRQLVVNQGYLIMNLNFLYF